MGLDTYLAKFRIYDPSIGRWWHIDPIDKEDLSSYIWVTNNPIVYADPYGLDSVRYDDLPDTNFNPDEDVVILDEVEIEDTYTGPKAEDSPNIRHVRMLAKRAYWIDNGPAPGNVDFDPLTQLSLGFTAVSAFKGVTAFATSQAANTAAQEGTYIIYTLVDKAGKVRYVGITSRAVQTRLAEHFASSSTKAGLRLGKTYGGNLTKQAARKMEQELILKHWGPDLLNKINSIAPKNWPTFGIKP